MKKIIFIMMALMVSIITRADNNATLHLITIAATEDDQIGESSKADVTNVTEQFKEIADMLQIKYNETVIQKNDYSKQSLTNAVNNLKAESNDIIVFIYSGHGFRYDNDSDPYPRMYLAYQEALSDNNQIESTEIYNMVVEKNARLTLFITDCCNNKFGNTRDVTEESVTRRDPAAKTDIQKLEKLFMESKGVIRTTSAKAGQKAVCDRKGGFLINAILANISAVTKKSYEKTTSWETIVDNATKVVAAKTKKAYEENKYSDENQIVVRSLNLAAGNGQSGNTQNDEESDEDEDNSISTLEEILCSLICFAISISLIFLGVKKIMQKKSKSATKKQ